MNFDVEIDHYLDDLFCEGKKYYESLDFYDKQIMAGLLIKQDAKNKKQIDLDDDNKLAYLFADYLTDGQIDDVFELLRHLSENAIRLYETEMKELFEAKREHDPECIRERQAARDERDFESRRGR